VETRLPRVELIQKVSTKTTHNKKTKFAHREAQPNQEYVFSKRVPFFNSLKSKVGHIMAKAMALRVNLNLAPGVLSPLLRAPARNS
jgi:hypothetical protein